MEVSETAVAPATRRGASFTDDNHCGLLFLTCSHPGHRLGGHELLARLLPFAAETGQTPSGSGFRGFRFLGLRGLHSPPRSIDFFQVKVDAHIPDPKPS